MVIVDRYIKEKEYLHYKQAWQLLYSRQKEDDKQFLDKVWKDSEKAEGFIMKPKAQEAQAKTSEVKTSKRK